MDVVSFEKITSQIKGLEPVKRAAGGDGGKCE